MKEGYSINQNLETNLNHPTRNPPPKKFIYKPRHFEHARLFLITTPVSHYDSTSVTQFASRVSQDRLAALNNTKSLHREFQKIGQQLSAV